MIKKLIKIGEKDGLPIAATIHKWKYENTDGDDTGYKDLMKKY